MPVDCCSVLEVVANVHINGVTCWWGEENAQKEKEQCSAGVQRRRLSRGKLTLVGLDQRTFDLSIYDPHLALVFVGQKRG